MEKQTTSISNLRNAQKAWLISKTESSSSSDHKTLVQGCSGGDLFLQFKIVGPFRFFKVLELTQKYKMPISCFLHGCSVPCRGVPTQSESCRSFACRAVPCRAVPQPCRATAVPCHACQASGVPSFWRSVPCRFANLPCRAVPCRGSPQVSTLYPVSKLFRTSWAVFSHPPLLSPQ